MSKNERLFRTLIAGFVFLGVGVVAIRLDDSTSVKAVSRGIAALSCTTTDCQKLENIKAKLALGPSAESTGVRKTKAVIETWEAGLLGEAGRVLVSIFSDRDVVKVSDVEKVEVAHFLLETFERDGAGIALEGLESGIGEAKTAQFISKIEGELDAMDASGVVADLVERAVIKPTTYANFRAKLVAFRDGSN
jgi:hypothetical protein